MTADVNKRFVAWLKAERKQAGMSQDKLAALLSASGFKDINPQYLTKVETGRRVTIPLHFAVAVAAIFGATPDVALGLVAGEAEARRLAGRRTAALYELRDTINAELAVSS